MARAYFIANNPISPPPRLLSVDEFVVMPGKIKLKYFEQNTLLRYKTENESEWKPSRYSHDDIFSISRRNISSLDEILKDLELPITFADLQTLLIKSRSTGKI